MSFVLLSLHAPLKVDIVDLLSLLRKIKPATHLPTSVHVRRWTLDLSYKIKTPLLVLRERWKRKQWTSKNPEDEEPNVFGSLRKNYLLSSCCSLCFTMKSQTREGRKQADRERKLWKKILCRRKVFHSLCFPVDEGHQTLSSKEEDFRLFSPTSFAVLPTSSPIVAADCASTRLVCKVLNRCSFLCTEFLNENEKKRKEKIWLG